MPRLIRLVIAAGMVFGASIAPASPLIEAPISWGGEGQFRAELDGPVRKARCRLASEPSETAAGFRLSGKCAAPSGSATIDLRVERRSGGRISGAMGSSVIEGTIQLSGTESDNGVVLLSREPLSIDGQEMDFQIELSWPSPGTMTLNEWLTPVGGGETTQIVWVTLFD